MDTFRLKILASDRRFTKGTVFRSSFPRCADSRESSRITVILFLRSCRGGWNSAFSTEKRKRNFPARYREGIIKTEDNEVLILVATAEYPEEIDENRARRAADAAREELLQKQSVQEYYAAKARLARAVNRLKVKKHRTDEM